ncbi:MAG: hypothetical protein ACYCOU_20885, partial [Sulfobacillus sp.]
MATISFRDRLSGIRIETILGSGSDAVVLKVSLGKETKALRIVYPPNDRIYAAMVTHQKQITAALGKLSGFAVALESFEVGLNSFYLLTNERLLFKELLSCQTMILDFHDKSEKYLINKSGILPIESLSFLSGGPICVRFIGKKVLVAEAEAEAETEAEAEAEAETEAET